jgi:hypothetical protein
MKFRRECDYAKGAIQYSKTNHERDDKELDKPQAFIQKVEQLNYDSSIDGEDFKKAEKFMQQPYNPELLLTFDAKMSG